MNNARRTFLATFAAALLTGGVKATTVAEVVDGNTWNYTVCNGEATVGDSSTSSTAVSTSTSGAIAIPKTLGGYKVTAIGDSAFKNCKKITAIEIPNGILRVGAGAFENCTAVQEIRFPESVVEIGRGACYHMDSLLEATIAGPVEVLDDTFSECRKLVKVNIGDAVRQMIRKVFGVSFELETIVFPETLSLIDCSMLTYGCFQREGRLKRCVFLGPPPTIKNFGTSLHNKILYSTKYAAEWKSWLTANNITGAKPFNAFAFSGGALGVSAALDCMDLTFSTSGDAEWSGVLDWDATDYTCARSGPIGDSQSSWIETTVMGTGTVSFRWRVSSQTRKDLLSFSIDGESMAAIGGTAASVTNWTAMTFEVEGGGAHVLRWTYAKNPSGSAGEDCGWLDDVQWRPPAVSSQDYGDALEETNLVWRSGSDSGNGAVWQAVTNPYDFWEDGDLCVAQSSSGSDILWLETSVDGPGEIEFHWKTAGVSDQSGLAFMIDGEDAAYLAEDQWWWAAVRIPVNGMGKHTLRWELYWDCLEPDENENDWFAGFLDGVSWTSAASTPIPALAPDATPPTVTNAIERAGFADEAGVMAAVGGSATRYADFKAWAQGVAGGEAAVVASRHASVSWLLGAEALFAHEPEIRFASLALARGTGNGMSVTVEVRDGEEIAQVDAAKVARMFEATSDLGDWYGKAKLTPTIGDLACDPKGTMTFTVIPGDGMAANAFLRIRVK